MPIDYSSTANIESVQRRALLPDSQTLYPASDIVKILTEELHADVVPLLMSVKEDYLIAYNDQSITTTQNTYAIPSRAIGNKLRDVVLLNSNGQEVSLPRLDADQLQHMGYNGNYSLFTYRRGFYFKDDLVFIYPDATSLGQFSLRMKFFRRPNNIVQTSDAGQITIINTVTKEVTIGNLPTTWTTATTFDFIKGTPPFKSWADDQTITLINSATKTLTFSSLPSGLAVGDWVSEAGTSPLAQIPYEVHNLLEQRAAIKILEGLGDRQGLQSAADVYKDMVDKFKILVTPRADGSPKKISRGSHFFGAGSVRGWW